MKVAEAHFSNFRDALAVVEPTAFGLSEVSIYPGATHYSPRSIVLCRFASSDQSSITAAAEEAARLLTARLGIEMAWGTATEGTEQVCWVEFFPTRTAYPHAPVTLLALQAAFARTAAARSGSATHRQAADRETASFEQAPAKQIYLQSRFLITAARNAGIPVANVAASDTAWQFGWGSRSDIFYGTGAIADSMPGHQLTWRKNLAKALFQEIGIPTPAWRMISDSQGAMRAADQVGWPCVVKPPSRAFGTGVTANIRTAAELQVAVAAAQQYSTHVIVEAQEPGADHRLMVVDGQLVAAARREAPFVTGDGKSSVGQLIAELNRGRDGTRENGYLLPVETDEALAATLAQERLSLDSVLATGAALQLRSIANFSTGGSVVDVTDKVHPHTRGLAELIAAAVGLRTAGIDYITTDISRSHDEVGGGFIEVNSMPRLRLLMVEGHSEEDIGSIVLGARPGRIPTTLVLGSSEMLDELSAPVKERTAARSGAAAVAPGWAQIGATPLAVSNLDPFGSVAAVVRHLGVDELLVLWSAAHIEEFGLPLDRFERAVIIGKEIDKARLKPFCAEIVVARDARTALEALPS